MFTQVSGPSSRTRGGLALLAVGDEGRDVVTVRLAEADLRRVPESRIQTAHEASLNC